MTPSDDEKPKQSLVYLLCDDMIFTSRITGVANNFGSIVKCVHSQKALLAAVQSESPSCVILDLQNSGLEIEACIKTLKESSSLPPNLVAYGSHVAAEVLHRAQEAGCDVVLPRSKFVEELPKSLGAWASGKSKR